MFGWDVSQSLDLQHPGRVKNRRQLFVGDADLAIVHETQQGFHVTILDIAQDDDRMLARIRLHQRMDQFIRKTCCIGLVFATLVFFILNSYFQKKSWHRNEKTRAIQPIIRHSYASSSKEEEKKEAVNVSGKLF